MSGWRKRAMILMSLFWIPACTQTVEIDDSQGDFELVRFVEMRMNQELDPPNGPLTLSRAIEEAISVSPELEQIQRRIEAADQLVRQAEAAFFPRLIFSEGFQVTDNPVLSLMHIINQRRLKVGTDFNDPGRQQDIRSSVTGSWSVFEGGVRLRRRLAAIHSMEARKAELLAARNRLIATVSETYYRWLQARGFIAVAQDAVNAALTNERIAQARVEAQTALRSELMRLKSRTAEARQNLVTSRTAAQRLKAALERLIARPISEKEVPHLEILPSSNSLSSTISDPWELVREALSRRPEIKAINSMIEAARQRVAEAKGALLPTVSVNSQFDWHSEELAGGGTSWLFSAQATFPLFQGGLTISRIREAQARLKEMESKGRQVALDVALDVYHSFLALKEANEKLKVAAQRSKWARMALEEVRAQYRNEVVTVEALLQAEVANSRAQASLTAARFDVFIARAALKRAMGEFARWTEAKND
jgi:outer membrane protein TolC